ncbi:MAG: alpha/beta fold hydrolase [Candidatus Nealsonbacteria bacterium]|nr:alpha/beta fold hydrolase [Candidatus Nealsonbacteria bacterium]
MAEKVIVFLHGFQSQKFDPEEKGRAIKERLSKDGWKVYSISYSSGLPTKEPLDYYSIVLVQMINDLGLKRIDAVIGHSMGGLIACSLAKRYRRYGIKTVIMLETPILGVSARLLRIWRFLLQRRTSFSWSSIQDMKQGSSFLIYLNEDWPTDIRRFEIAGSLSVAPILKRAYEIPEEIPVKVFPKVRHDGPTGLRADPEVLEYIAKLLQ